MKQLATALCLLPLLAGCGGGGGLRIYPANDVVILGPQGVYVGQEFQLTAFHTDGSGDAIHGFWSAHAYTWDNGGLGYFEDATRYDADGTMDCRFRATDPGRHTVVLTVYTLDHTPSPVMNTGSFTVNVY